MGKFKEALKRLDKMSGQVIRPDYPDVTCAEAMHGASCSSTYRRLVRLSCSEGREGKLGVGFCQGFPWVLPGVRASLHDLGAIYLLQFELMIGNNPRGTSWCLVVPRRCQNNPEITFCTAMYLFPTSEVLFRPLSPPTFLLRYLQPCEGLAVQ